MKRLIRIVASLNSKYDAMAHGRRLAILIAIVLPGIVAFNLGSAIKYPQ